MDRANSEARARGEFNPSYNAEWLALEENSPERLDLQAHAERGTCWPTHGSAWLARKLPAWGASCPALTDCSMISGPAGLRGEKRFLARTAPAHPRSGRPRSSRIGKGRQGRSQEAVRDAGEPL